MQCIASQVAAFEDIHEKEQRVIDANITLRKSNVIKLQFCVFCYATSSLHANNSAQRLASCVF